MKLNLSKVELRVLKVLSSGSFSASGLAAELGVKPAFVSRLLHSLAGVGLITVQKQGTQKLVSLSEASHAQAFKRLFSSRPQLDIENWLSGKAIAILIPLTPEVKLSSKELLRESRCSLATLLKVMKKLGAIGAASKQNESYLITDNLVKSFISSFADNLHLIMQKNLKGYNVGLRIGKHVVVRTDAASILPWFIETGMNRLSKEGLEAIRTSYSDYYFTLDAERRNISLEEAFIHALFLSTLQQHQDFPVLAIFLKKNVSRFDLFQLRKYADKYCVSSQLIELQKSLELLDKLGETK